VSNTTCWYASGEQARELVQGGDLRGARARELLAHRRALRVARPVAELREHAEPVALGRDVGVDVGHGEPGDTGHRHRLVAQIYAEDLVEVGRRVGADEQDPLARVGERERRGRGERGLPDAALAREEEEARGGGEEARAHRAPCR
jgi:hypothetical protein